MNTHSSLPPPSPTLFFEGGRGDENSKKLRRRVNLKKSLIYI